MKKGTFSIEDLKRQLKSLIRTIRQFECFCKFRDICHLHRDVNLVQEAIAKLEAGK